MNKIEPTLQHILSHDIAPNAPLKASDLDFYMLLRRQAEESRLFFNQRRAVIFDAEAMGTLRQQLIESLGTELAMGVLTRFGYAHGYNDATMLSENFEWETEADWLAAGPSLHMLEGIVHVEPQKVEFNRETGHFHMHGVWLNSYEAEEHLRCYGVSDQPVCWTLTGYASGYATRFFGQELLAIETECVGKGDARCYWEIRPVQQWGSEGALYRKALEKVDVSSQLVESNRQLQEQIMENACLFQQTETALAEQKRLSAELENQRAMLQAVLQSIPAGVFVAEAPTGKPLLSNKYAEEILGKGISPEAGTEELAQIYAAYRYGSDELYPATEMPLVRGMLGETSSVNDMEIRRPDGSSALLQVFGAPVYDISGQVISSVAIFQDITERKQVEEANLERTQLNVFTAEISLALTQSAALRDMLQKCAEIMVKHLDAAFARIWTFNPAENMLELQASAGMYTHIDGPHMRVPVGKFKIGLIAQERQAHLTNDILNDPRLGDKEWAKREGMIAFAGYPLIVGGHLVGVMAMFARRPLKEEVLQAMKSIANTVAISIERKKFEQILTKRALELEAFAEVSTAISTILDTSTLLYRVSDLVKENFGLYHAHIYLLNEAGNTLDLAAGAGKVGRKMVKQGWNIPLAQERSLVAEAARARKAIIVNDVHQNPDFLPNPLLPETRSEMAVPLIVGDNVLGVLDVQANVINRFTEEDVPIKTTLAGQIAVALENTRLFEKQRALTSESRHLLEQTQARASREQILREVTARVRSSVDPDTIMRIAAQEVGKALGRPAFVYLGNGEGSQTSTKENETPE